jgi:L-lactate dehydrogenase (cytochrome)
MVSSNASLSYAQIISSATPSQPLFFQLYKHANNDIAEKRVREVEALGYKAICLTVDAIVPGNRERDIRSPWELEDMERGEPEYYEDSADEVQSGGEKNTLGTAGALIVNDDRDMTWETVRGSQ